MPSSPRPNFGPQRQRKSSMPLSKNTMRRESRVWSRESGVKKQFAFDSGLQTLDSLVALVERFIMKKFLPVAFCLMLSVLCVYTSARAQGGAPKSGPDPTTLRDPELERDSLKNLEAAKLYFNMRKAYRASLARCEEIIAGNPNVTRIDEAIWFAGMSVLYLSQGKGKQAADPKV